MKHSMRFSTCALALLLSLSFLSGCGKTTGELKGQIVEDGKPKSFESNEAALQLTMIGPDGKFDNNHSYTAVVNNDGSFEVVASGGELRPGTYQVALQFRGGNPTYKSLAAPESPIRREIKSGRNQFIIDLAKPQG